MCVSIGTTPLAEEMPVDFLDLKEESGTAIHAYNLLRSKAQDYGKDFTNIESIFKILDIPANTHEIILELMILIDNDIIDRDSTKAKNGSKLPKNDNPKNKA